MLVKFHARFCLDLSAWNFELHSIENGEPSKDLGLEVNMTLSVTIHLLKSSHVYYTSEFIRA